MTTNANAAPDKCTVLPDGSAFAAASYPLPKDHWLYAPREYEPGAEEPKELPHPILTHAFRAEVVAAVRYAIRGATMCGKEPDFDPDALVQNAVYALCGPYGKAALSTAAQPPVNLPTVGQVEEAIGMGHGAWDMVNPAELIAAVLKLTAEPRDDSDRSYNKPVGYLPAYELGRLRSGHDAQLRSAKFGPSALDSDVPVYLELNALALVGALLDAQSAIHSMKTEAETAAQGDEQMMLEACEQISNEGLDAWMAIQATLAAAPAADPAQPERVPLTEKQIVECLVSSGCLGVVKMSSDSGPYSITRTSGNSENFVRAIEAAHGIKPAKEQRDD